MTRSGFLAVGAAALSILVYAPGASAAGADSAADGIAVRFSQESLDNPEDAARVYAKLKRASRKACGIGGGFLNLSERTLANRCYEQTLGDVVSKINRPLLTSVHESKPSQSG